MITLTKDQIQSLTPEQQDLLALIEIQAVQKRQQLLAKLSPYRGQQWLPALVVGIFVLGSGPIFPKWFPLSVVTFGSLLFLIQFHAAGVNRRLDALVKLLESDKK